MNSLIVQKYGGSSLATADHIRRVARHVVNTFNSKKRVLVVVSAMGKTTDELVNLAYSLSDNPNRRELDMLLSTGERVSMSLMSMAIQDLGLPAVSFTGSQAGVLTDATHSSARIHDLKPTRVEEALQQGRVPVLAGFQGVNPTTKEITTLGRGGSDTTAVALAAHFGAQECQILKDVAGVYTADPRIVPSARPLPELSYGSLAEMCFWGAKVLHFRSVSLAQKLEVPLFVGATEDPTSGTKIRKEVAMYERDDVLSINSHEEVHHFRIQAPSTEAGLKVMSQFLDSKRLPWPQLLASAYEEPYLRLMVTGTPETIQAIKNGLSQFPQIEDLNMVLSSVTATCNGSISTEVLERMVSCLAEENIPVQKVIASPLSISVFVPKAMREAAIRKASACLIY